jgi:hypothetical protein
MISSFMRAPPVCRANGPLEMLTLPLANVLAGIGVTLKKDIFVVADAGRHDDADVPVYSLPEYALATS